MFTSDRVRRGEECQNNLSEGREFTSVIQKVVFQNVNNFRKFDVKQWYRFQ